MPFEKTGICIVSCRCIQESSVVFNIYLMPKSFDKIILFQLPASFDTKPHRKSMDRDIQLDQMAPLISLSNSHLIQFITIYYFGESYWGRTLLLHRPIVLGYVFHCRTCAFQIKRSNSREKRYCRSSGIKKSQHVMLTLEASVSAALPTKNPIIFGISLIVEGYSAVALCNLPTCHGVEPRGAIAPLFIVCTEQASNLIRTKCTS